MSGVHPRKRATQARSRATVEAVLEATARILEESGPHAVTTNAIAHRAGISVGSLYQYYPGRDAIFAELLRRKLARLRTDLASALDEDGYDAQVDALLFAAARQQLERPRFLSALSAVETIVPVADELAAERAKVFALVADFLQVNGASEPHRAARDVIAIVWGMADAAAKAGDTSREALIGGMRRAVLGYLQDA